MNHINEDLQTSIYLHMTLRDDVAYRYSVGNDDAFNMRLVLRAHSENNSIEAAELQIETAKSIGFDA